MAGNKGFTNRAKSGAVAQRARIAQSVERQKTQAKNKPSTKPPRPK